MISVVSCRASHNRIIRSGSNNRPAYSVQTFSKKSSIDYFGKNKLRDILRDILPEEPYTHESKMIENIWLDISDVVQMIDEYLYLEKDIDPLETHCNANPGASECRVYDV